MDSTTTLSSNVVVDNSPVSTTNKETLSSNIPNTEAKSPADVDVKVIKDTVVGWIEAQERRFDEPPGFFKESWLGQSWHNALAVFAICYFTYLFAGWFGFSLSGCFLLWAVFATYYDISIRRFRRKVRDDTWRELQKQRIQIDAESSEWLNHFLERFWLIYEPVLCSTILASVNPILDFYCPSFLESIALTHFTLGSKGPRIEQIRTYTKTEQDVVMMDWDLSFVPGDNLDLTQRQIRNRVDPKIVLTIRLGKGLVAAGIPILVEDVTFQGKLRLRLKLMNNFPHIKLVEFHFLEPPHIDYELKPVGGETFGFDIAHLPGLQGFIRDTIHSVLEGMMYAPNWYTLDLDAMMNGPGYGEIASAIGVLKVTIRSAKNVKAADLLGKSDPYVKISINKREELARTTVRENTLAPTWEETFFLLITDLHEPLGFDINDWNQVKADKWLGEATFDMSTLEEKPLQEDLELKIIREKGKSGGELNLGLWYYPVAVPVKMEDGTEVLPTSNMGILRYTIHQAKELDSKKSMVGQLNPYAVMKLNGEEIRKTKTLKRNNNPVWEDVGEVFCADLNAVKLALEIRDSRDLAGDVFLGSWEMTGVTALEKTKTQMDWFALSNAKSGKVKLSFAWKPIITDNRSLAIVGSQDSIGMIRIHVKQARNLHNTELTGQADPYTQVRVGKNVYAKTRVVDSNLNPEFDEVLYTPVYRLQQKVYLEVYDWNQVKKDALIGLTEFSVSDLVDKAEDGTLNPRPELSLTRELSTDEEKHRGNLSFTASFHPIISTKPAPTVPVVVKEGETTKEAVAETDESVKKEDSQEVEAKDEEKDNVEPEAEKKEEEAIDYTKYQCGLMKLTVIGASGFVKKRDMYCDVLVNNNEYNPAMRTAVKKNTIEPDWNETAEFFIKETEFGIISFLIKEKSDDNDLLASQTLLVFDMLRDFSENPNGVKEYGFDITGVGQGKLKVNFHFTPIDFVLPKFESMMNMGTVTVNILDAKNLPALDNSGTSDPYVVLLVDENRVFKTKTVKKDLNPTFQETTQITLKSLSGSKVRYEVFDWNLVNGDEYIGGARIDLSILEPRIPLQRAWPMDEHPSSSLNLRLNFVPGFVNHVARRSTTLGSATLSVVNPVNQAKTIMTLGGAFGKGVSKGAMGGVNVLGSGVTALGKGFGSVFKKKDHENAPPAQSNLPVNAPGGSPVSTPLNIAANISSSRLSVSNVSISEADRSVDSQKSVPNLSVTEAEGSTIREDNNSARSIHNSDVGTLLITLIEGRNLKAMDRGGSSDPYVKIYHGKKEIGKSRHISKTLNPQWNDQISLPNVSLDSLILQYEVKDYNRIGVNPTIGEVTMEVWNYLHADEESKDVWLQLSNEGGEIHVKLEFQPGQSPSDMKKPATLFSFKK